MDEQTADAVFDAATVNQGFLAVIVAALVKRGLLTVQDVADAIEAELGFIEVLRQTEDPQLRALALERLCDSVSRKLGADGAELPPKPAWRFDPAAPTWPSLPDNDY